MLEIKKKSNKKIAFNGLISRLDMTEETIVECEDNWKYCLKLNSKKEKGVKKEQYSRTMEQLQKCSKCIIGTSDKAERERNRRNNWSNN